jgi:hypothetical protein
MSPQHRSIIDTRPDTSDVEDRIAELLPDLAATFARRAAFAMHRSRRSRVVGNKLRSIAGVAIVLFLLAVVAPLGAHAGALGRRGHVPSCVPSLMPFLTIWEQPCPATSRPSVQSQGTRRPTCKQGRKSTAATSCRTDRGPNAR